MVILVFYGLHPREYDLTKLAGENLSKENIPYTKFFDLKYNKKIKDILKENNPPAVIDIHGGFGEVPDDWKENGVTDMITFLTEDPKAYNGLQKYLFSPDSHIDGIIGGVAGPEEIGEDTWRSCDNLVSKNCLKMNIPCITVEILKEPSEDVIRYLSNTLKFLVDLYGS